jgi:hypothetical protein
MNIQQNLLWFKEHWQEIRLLKSAPTFPPIDVVSLEFLLLHPEGRECLDAILLADAQYRQMLTMLEQRNILYDSYLDKTQKIDNNTHF